MDARTTVAYVIPGKADEAIQVFRDKVVPEIKKQPGFVSTAIYIDRDTNMAQTVSLWDSKEALDATARPSKYLGKVVGELRSCLVNRDYANREVGHLEQSTAGA